MNPILERVDKLTNLGVDAVQTTVSAYTHYIFFSSLFYIIFAVILFLAGIMNTEELQKNNLTNLMKANRKGH